MGKDSPERKIQLTRDWREEEKILINPSWVLQSIVLCLLAVSGFFIRGSMETISQEIQLSRIERAQLRADLSALEIGLRGDRFTQSDWRREQAKMENVILAIQKRLVELERQH